MARQPRLTLPGYPHHIIQRGNNRQAIFAAPGDQQKLLDLLADYAEQFNVAVHAYVLMSNHIHLLATPSTVDGLPLMMQALGRSYVRWFNTSQGRSGTLWEGRYKSTVIQTERYLLACMVYIDLNPLRAGLVAQPRAYPWSSHLHYVGQRHDKWLSPHPLYWELGNTPFAREAAYSDLVVAGVSANQQALMTQSTLSGWALGEPDFVADLQKRTERRVARARLGRPVGTGSVK
jgi:putative transposase